MLAVVSLPNWSDLQPFLPEMVLVATVAVTLLLPVFSPKKNSLGVGIVAGLGLAAALGCLLGVNTLGTWANVDGGQAWQGSAHLGGLLVMDPFAWFFKLSILLFAVLVVALWVFTTRGSMGPGDAPEFFTLLLTATTGLCLMGSTSNLLMIFLAMETASLPSYVLAGFRKTHRLGAEAALKYVLFGAVSSAVMLFGMSLIYGLGVKMGYSQPLDISTIARAAAGASQAENLVIIFCVVGLLVGIGFKIAMVPVHFWAPDVFEGTHIDVAAFLSVASKAGGLALLMRVMMSLLGGATPPANLHWVAVAVLVLGTITCFWGNLAAFAQNNIKRLLAYSSIAHAGYMLLGVAVVAAENHARAPESLLFYLFMYVFVNAGAFIAAAAIAQQIGSEDIRDYAGLGRRSPILAACMVVFVFSLVGIPLTVGFAAKFKLLLILFGSGTVIGYVGLGVLGVNTVIAAFYYFRIIRQMYLVGSEKPAVSEITPTVLLAAALVVPSIGLFFAYSYVDRQTQAFAHVYTTSEAPRTATPAAGAAPLLGAAR